MISTFDGFQPPAMPTNFFQSVGPGGLEPASRPQINFSNACIIYGWIASFMRQLEKDIRVAWFHSPSKMLHANYKDELLEIGH